MDRGSHHLLHKQPITPSALLATTHPEASYKESSHEGNDALPSPHGLSGNRSANANRWKAQKSLASVPVIINDITNNRNMPNLPPVLPKAYVRNVYARRDLPSTTVDNEMSRISRGDPRKHCIPDECVFT